MHFEDLSPCRYGNDDERDPQNWRAPLLAVGWLEHPHPFNQGAAPEGFTARICTLRRGFLFRVFCGLHSCSICVANGVRRSRTMLGFSCTTIFIPGDGVIYLAPGAIDHYIETHSYLPPAQFVDAVFACPEPQSPQYRQALRAANAGVKTPLCRGTQ